MNILLSGINGFMGKEVVKIINATDGINLVGGVDVNLSETCPVPCAKTFDEANSMFNGVKIDCIIDFSHHLATNDLINYAVKNNLPLVLATTGQTEE
ncbi:MAG: 4-hydroxy-tetrahydrodipicolinate reductase, partial [Clostridia bacterium]|nr:4-hydroxy-tetrahydrodipicolinate reductase [Clostridia bacterium]